MYHATVQKHTDLTVGVHTHFLCKCLWNFGSQRESFSLPEHDFIFLYKSQLSHQGKTDSTKDSVSTEAYDKVSFKW